MKENVRFAVLIVVVAALVGGAWFLLNGGRKTDAPGVAGVPTPVEQTESAPEAPPERPIAKPSGSFQVSGGRNATDRAASQSRPSGKCSIKGTVTENEGKTPVPGAAIRIVFTSAKAGEDPTPGGPEWTAETDSAGKFRARGLPIAIYAIVATTDDSLGIGSATLTDDEPDATVDMDLRPAGFIAGRTVNEAGEPVAGAQVFPDETRNEQMRMGRSSATALATASDEDGSFLLPYLWAGDWKLTVKAEGYAVLVSPFLSIGSEDVDLVLTKGASVAGDVVAAESGEPIANIKVTVNAESFRAKQTVATNDTGQFSFATLADGKYTLTLDDPTRVLSGKAPEFSIAGAQDVEGLRLVAAVGGVVTGQAFDVDSGNPLEGVRIRGRSDSDRQTREATTDANGLYKLEGLGAGPYTIGRAWFEGYLHGERREDKKINAILGKTIAGIDFPMKYGLRVKGRVVDAQGQPIDNASVSSRAVNSGDEGEQTNTKEDGTFVHRGYSPNQKILITAQKAGFSAAPVGPLDLGATDLEGVEIIMGSGGSIAGVVVDKTGGPMKEATVIATPVGNPNAQPSGAGTDSEGRFKIQGLMPGEYSLAVRPMRSYSDFNKASTQVKVAEGQDVTGVQLVYEGAGGLTISGYVTDAAGKPVKNASINARTGTGRGGFGNAMSRDDGAYEIAGLQEGTYTVFAHHQDYSRKELEAEAGSANINFVLQGRGTVEGRVIDNQTGQPVANFQLGALPGHVDLQQPFGYGNLTAFYDPDGNFKLEDVEVGTAYLMVRAEGYSPAQQEVSAVSEGTTVSGVLFRLDPGASLEGLVTDQNGQPVANARIFLGQAPGEYDQWRMEQGSVGMSDAAGRFQVTSLSTEVTLVSAVHPDFGPGSSPVTLTPGTATQVTIKLGGGGTISGTVRVAGAPVAGQYVGVHSPTSGGQPRQAQTDANGTYTINGIPEGQVYVSASINPAAPGQGSGSRHSSQTAEVAEGQTTVVDFDFAGGTAVIEGHITMNGQPLTQGQVGATLSSQGGGGESFNSQIDPTGYYRIEGLPAGAVTMHVSFQAAENDWQTRVVQVTTADGQATRKDVEIMAGTTVTGSVGGISPEEHSSVVLLRGQVEITTFDRDFWMANQNLVVGGGQVRPDGTFSFGGVEPGSYTLCAFAMVPNPGQPEDLSNIRLASQSVEVGSEGIVTVNLALP